MGVYRQGYKSLEEYQVSHHADEQGNKEQALSDLTIFTSEVHDSNVNRQHHIEPGKREAGTEI